MKGKLNETELRNELIKNNIDPNNHQVLILIFIIIKLK
jgi:hypothetical protein